MWKRSSTLLSLVVLTALTASCILDPDPDNGGPPPQTANYKTPAKNRSDVLYNIQLAYNRKNATKYDENLDNNFIFFLSDGDVNDGGLPAQWERAIEVEITCNMFIAVRRVEMDIQFEDGIQWDQVIPESAPDEVWETTTVFYDFTIEDGETTYIPKPGAKAQFTVRNTGTEENPNWKLIEFRDLGSSQ